MAHIVAHQANKERRENFLIKQISNFLSVIDYIHRSVYVKCYMLSRVLSRRGEGRSAHNKMDKIEVLPQGVLISP